MKRVLLLAYFFPPRTAAGSPRATHLAKYLERFGYEPTVVTAKFSSGEPSSGIHVLQTGYSDVVEQTKQRLRIPKHVSGHAAFGSETPKAGDRMTARQRFVEAAFKIVAFPDPHIGWLKHAVPVVSEELATHKYQAIISTSFPYTAHLIARRALGDKGIAWIADLRDPWRGNSLIRGAPRIFHRILERRTLKRANAITTVSQPLAQDIGSDNRGIPTYEIRNAFDPEDWTDIPFARPQHFTLTYAGSLYQGLRDPEPLFDALLQEFESGEMERGNVKLAFYVEPESWLLKAVEQRGLQDIVSIKGYVDRSEVLRAERSTSANLLILRNVAEEGGVYTGKLFEQIGANLPILAIGGPSQSVVREVVRRIGGFYATNIEEIRGALRGLYRSHVAGQDLRIDSTVISEFSAIGMVRRFAEVLDEITA